MKSLLNLTLSLLIIGFVMITQKGHAESRVVDTSLIDTATSPCEDFFQYACGQWLKKTEIPADKSRVYRFSEIDVNTENLLKGILTQYKNGQYTPKQKYAAKMGSFYGSCMNETASEKAGRKGVKNLVTRLENIRNVAPENQREELAKLVGEFHKLGISAFFNAYVDQDPGDATQVIPQFDQGGLALPEKGYYLDQDDEMKKSREEYFKHLKKVFKLAGMEETFAAVAAHHTFAIEYRLADVSLSPIERRDPKSIYHKMNLNELIKIAPEFDWVTYFNVIGLKTHSTLNVAVPSFFEGFSQMIKNNQFTVIVDYLIFHAVNSVADFSFKELMNANFEFYGKFLNGQKEAPPRWKECVASVDSYMGEALGESFVSVAFGAKAKNLSVTMMNQIQDEVRKMFGDLDWMDRFTMDGAIKKLNSLVKKVGYPEPSRNYDSLVVRSSSWFANVLAGNQFEHERQIAKIGKPIDRNEWLMTASTNNAYYNPLMNEIVFPAGILQEPLFGVDADLAANYGATGATVGHEITHGFDDEGRQFDEKGNLNNWWSVNSTDRFNEKAQCLVKQYDAYQVADGVHVQGALTLGENIADLGGLKIALKAYQSVSPTAPQQADYKRFFTAYAQSWCGKATPEYEKNIVQVDPHSPAKFRVNGVVVNMPEFSDAFSCKQGQAMSPVQRCQIW